MGTSNSDSSFVDIIININCHYCDEKCQAHLHCYSISSTHYPHESELDVVSTITLYNALDHGKWWLVGFGLQLILAGLYQTSYIYNGHTHKHFKNIFLIFSASAIPTLIALRIPSKAVYSFSIQCKNYWLLTVCINLFSHQRDAIPLSVWAPSLNLPHPEVVTTQFFSQNLVL